MNTQPIDVAPAKSEPKRRNGGGALRIRLENLPAIWEWFLLAASYAVLFFEPHWVGADGGLRFDALSRVLEGQERLPEKWALFAKHPVQIEHALSLVGPLFSAPLWYLGKVWLKDPRLACSYYNWVVLGVGLVVFARLLRGLMAPSTIRRFLLILTAASMFTFHVQGFYGEVFTAVCVGAGVLSVCTKRRAWLGWVAIVLGTVNTPASGLATGALCLAFALREKRLKYFLPIVFVVLISVVESILHRGGLQSGYEGTRSNKTFMPYSGLPDFSYPILLGILGLTVSVGKGIFFYAPGILAKTRDRLEANAPPLEAFRFWLLFLAGLLVVYAKWWGWYGGEFWGPRYVLFASIPASFALALNLETPGSIPRAAATLAMLTLSFWIGADGTLFGQENLGICAANGYALEHLCWWVPEFAAWIRPFIVHHALTRWDWVVFSVTGTVYVWLAARIALFLVSSIVPPCVSQARRIFARAGWAF